MWSKISGAIENDQLICAKVSTVLRSMGRNGHVICVYTRDWADRQDVMRAREVLKSLASRRNLATSVTLIHGTGFTALVSGTYVPSQPTMLSHSYLNRIVLLCVTKRRKRH